MAITAGDASFFGVWVGRGHVEFRDAGLRVEGTAFDQMHSIDANWNMDRLPDWIPNIRTMIRDPDPAGTHAWRLDSQQHLSGRTGGGSSRCWFRV